MATYFSSVHCAKLKEANTQTLKSRRVNFTDRTAQKNTIILRHYFERLREHFGPWDGLRHAKNYLEAGWCHALPAHGPESAWDAHVFKWQMELLDEGHITPEEFLSPASIGMLTRWAVTKQPFDSLWKIRKATFVRRIAVTAGWLLTIDLIELEKANYAVGFDFSKSIDEEQTAEEDVDITPLAQDEASNKAEALSPADKSSNEIPKSISRQPKAMINGKLTSWVQYARDLLMAGGLTDEEIYQKVHEIFQFDQVKHKCAPFMKYRRQEVLAMKK